MTRVVRVIFCNGTPIASQPNEALAESFCAERHRRYPKNKYWHEPGQITQAGFAPVNLPVEEVDHG